MAEPLGKGLEGRIKRAIQNIQDLMFLGGKSGDAVDLLIQDHKFVKRLFRRFKHAKDPRIEAGIVDQLLPVIKIHSKLEEEFIYPLLRRATEDAETLDEAAEEHHLADMLISEIEAMHSGDEHYHAKVVVLSEVVEHHADEEEHHLLPKLKRSKHDLSELAKKMVERKKALMAGNKPTSAEPGKSRRVRTSAGRAQILETVEDKPKKNLTKRVKVEKKSAVDRADSVSIRSKSQLKATAEGAQKSRRKAPHPGEVETH